jgi:hypothetical protein
VNTCLACKSPAITVDVAWLSEAWRNGFLHPGGSGVSIKEDIFSQMNPVLPLDP